MSLMEFTAEKQATFLKALARRGIVAAACRAARVSRTTVYERRRDDAEFAAAWEEAEEIAADVLEEEGWRRAHNGTLKPVYYQGDEVGAVREYSDTLLIFLLKSRNPKKFKDNLDVNHRGTIQHNLTPASVEELLQLDPKELAARYREALGESAEAQR